MHKKRYRWFFDCLCGQERWLNQMAKEGWRLVGTGKLCYEFEACREGDYEYRVEFAAHRSHGDLRNYQSFLEELGYRVFTKNANLNWSVGKVRLRPYGRGRGKIATSPGAYGKELLIVERAADGKPFSLHTGSGDLYDYYRTVAGAWATPLLLLLFLTVANWAAGNQIPAVGCALLGILGVFCLFQTARFWSLAAKHRKEARIQE